MGLAGAAIVMALPGCGLLGDQSGGHHRANTGGITAQARWPAAGFAAASSASTAATLPDSVATMRTTVSASDMDDVADEFDAGDGEGTIGNVPVGDDRTLTLEGLDAGGVVQYFARITGITVSKSKSTNAGTAVMIFAGPGGGLDPSFGGTGLITENSLFGGQFSGGDEATSVAVDKDDGLAVAGAGHKSNGTMVVWRLTEAGEPDSGFGGFASDNISGDDIANGVVIESGGRIVLAGTEFGSNNGTLVLVAHNSTGDRDNGFGTSGEQEFFLAGGGNEQYEGRSAVLDKDGNILVTGWYNDDSATPDGAMALWRFTSSGSLDSDFNSSGNSIGGPGYIYENAVESGTTGDDFGAAVILDTHRRPVVAGTSVGADFVDLATAWRRDQGDDPRPDDTLNIAVGSGGVFTAVDFPAPLEPSRGKAVAVDSDDNIYLAGSAGAPNASTFTVWKWNTDGDTAAWTFQPGDLCESGSSFPSEARAIQVDDSNRILVAGVCKSPDDPDGGSTMVVMRLDTGGNVDHDFGNGTGAVFVKNFLDAGLEIEVAAMVFDSHGRLVVAGHTFDSGGKKDMIVLRIKP